MTKERHNMKYLLLLLLAVACTRKAIEHKTVFDLHIYDARKWQQWAKDKTDTTIVMQPLHVLGEFYRDTVRIAPGRATPGYMYKIAIINDTLRIIDSVKIK